MATLDVSGLDRLHERFRRLANPDATPLMKTFMDIIDDDNRRGILAGTDKDGNPLVAVTYRPKPSALRLTAQQKNNPKRGARRGAFAGLGQQPAGLNNNLSSSEYRRLSGPPTAPRGAFSRVITNLKTEFGRISTHVWEAIGYWDQVVNRQGKTFLHYLFQGQGRFGAIPARDLRGVRPEGVRKAREAARAFVIDQVGTYDRG